MVLDAAPRRLLPLLAAAALLARGARARFAFALAPAALCPEQAVYNASMSAWGGSVIEVPEDPLGWRYHMYNGVYTQGCGVNYWRGNSAIAHLVSKTPQGPFSYHDEAVPLWHTNPQVVRDPFDGTFIIFAIGQDVNRSAWVECNCSARPACPAGPPNPNLAGVIDAHTSASPYGPWRPLVINGSTVVLRGATNPAPLFLPNGTLLLGVNAEGTKVAVVPDWRAGPYRYAPQGTLPEIPGVWWEDPLLFLYGGKFRQLVHTYNATDTGHQFATGGYGETAGDASVFADWQFGGLADPAYTNNVTYADGSVQELRRRERPKLLFAQDGRVWLYNAAQSPLNASRDFSYTHVQEVLAMPV
jgi:hypothetical protein